MKLKEYIKKLQKVAKTHSNATVIYSKDDEGNLFSELNYSPSLGNFCEGSFLLKASFLMPYNTSHLAHYASLNNQGLTRKKIKGKIAV